MKINQLKAGVVLSYIIQVVQILRKKIINQNFMIESKVI